MIARGIPVGFRVILVMALVLGLGLVAAVGIEKVRALAGTVNIVIDADNTTAGIQNEVTVTAGSQFTVVVIVQPQGGQEVSVVDARVDFDTNYLSVDNTSYVAFQNIVAHPSTLFGLPAYRNMDNTNGYADYSDGTVPLGSDPTDEFKMFYIVFNADSATSISGTQIMFHSATPRKTDAFVGANATVITGNLTGITVHIESANLIAETSISQGLDTSDIVVVKVDIDRTKDLPSGNTVPIPGGIGSYTATVNGTPGSIIEFLTVNGVSPFDGPSFNATTGVFSVATVASPIQAANTTVAELVPILTGNTTASVNLTIAFSIIGAADQPGLNVPEEHFNSIILLRGDADKNGVVSIVDSLVLKQYLVGQRTLSELNPLNAACVNHDGAGGDKISIVDALAIEQYLVGQINAYFE